MARGYRRNVAIAFDRIILAQWVTFPVVRHQDAAQIGMAIEANPEEIEDFPLEPIGAGPDGNERIHNSITGGEAYLQTQALAAGNRNQLIVDLETRLERVAVDAGGVAQQIKPEIFVATTALGNVAQHVARNDDGRLATKLDHFTDRVRAPSTQSLDHNISILVAVLRHSSRIPQKRRLLTPCASRTRPFSTDKCTRPKGWRCKRASLRSHIFPWAPIVGSYPDKCKPMGRGRLLLRRTR